MRRLTFLFVLLSACAANEPWPAHYLSTGIDRATQDEVVAQLGPPDKTTSSPDGGMEWHYYQRRGRSMVGPHGTMGSAKNSFSDLITPASCANGLHIWNRLVSPHTHDNLTHGSDTRG